jgi:hypothetical protein
MENNYRYYNSGNSLGIVAVPLNEIAHQNEGYTFLLGRQAKYQWIRTIDLHNNKKKAEKCEPATFFN